MKTVEGIVLRRSWNRKFCKVHRMTPNQTQGIEHQKCPRYVHCRIFPLTLNVKISKCHKIFNFLADRQNIHNLIFPYDCHIYLKVWPRSDNNYRRSSLFKFPVPNGYMLTKISKCHKIFKSREVTKTVTA